MPPKYKILLHNQIKKFLETLPNQRKTSIISVIEKLQDYPLSLREMATEKIKGLDRTFRIRSGKYRIIFYADNTNKTIYVTTITQRKKAYKK